MYTTAQNKITLPNPLATILTKTLQINNDESFELTGQAVSNKIYFTPEESKHLQNSEDTKDSL